MAKIIVIGGGGHAKVVISILLKMEWQVIGYSDNYDCGIILGVPYLGDDGILNKDFIANEASHAIIGIGKIDESDYRMILQKNIENIGFKFPIAISPTAVVNNEVYIGEGTIVCDGAVINSGSYIGRNCIINTNSTVEHDCKIKDNVHVAPGATICGNVHIGSNCFIGAGSNIAQLTKIPDRCLIGLGANVTGSLPSPGTYYGNPARFIK